MPAFIGSQPVTGAAGADLALIVVEPTVAGIHDMARVLATTRHFGVPLLVCVNKADLFPEGTAEIEACCRRERLPLVGRLSFDTVVTQAMVQGRPVTAYSPDSPISQALRAGWEAVLAIANGRESVP